ncbi:MAG: cation transporter [Candidatus Omnitrophica bacterium]|nr:cation transporter [Candidatus Omnitrophota bacterium]
MTFLKESPSHNVYNQAKKGAWIGVLGNLFLSLLKIGTGFFGRSMALITDGFHSLSDIASSLAVFFGLVIASKPKDESHPYGHGKAEPLVCLTISFLLIACAGVMFFKATVSLTRGEVTGLPAPATLWVVLFSILFKETMFRYKIQLAKKLKSTSLTADAWHHRSDALSSIVVAAAIGGSLLGGGSWQILDRIGAMIVAVMIIFVAVKIYLKAASELMDAPLDPKVVRQIEEAAGGVEGVKYIETLLTRKSGLDFLVDIHIEVDPELNVLESHAIASKVKRNILENLPAVKSVLVHVEPFLNKGG